MICHNRTYRRLTQSGSATDVRAIRLFACCVRRRVRSRLSQTVASQQKDSEEVDLIALRTCLEFCEQRNQGLRIKPIAVVEEFHRQKTAIELDFSLVLSRWSEVHTACLE